MVVITEDEPVDDRIVGNADGSDRLTVTHMSVFPLGTGLPLSPHDAAPATDGRIQGSHEKIGGKRPARRVNMRQ